MDFKFGQTPSTSGGGSSNPFGTTSLFGNSSAQNKPLFGSQTGTNTDEGKSKDGNAIGPQPPLFNFQKQSGGFSFGDKGGTSDQGNKTTLNPTQSATIQSPISTTPTTPGQKPLFGAASTTPATSSLFGSTTPATSGPSFLGQQSTTPAGPPPSSIFGAQKPADTTQTTSSSLFGKPATTTPGPSIFGQNKEGGAGGMGQANPFGTGLFGASQQNKSNTGNATSTPSTSFFSTTPAGTPQQPQDSTTPAPATTSQAPTGLFGAAPAASTKPGSNLFGGAQPTPSSQAQATSAAPAASKSSFFSFDKGPTQQSKPLFGTPPTTSSSTSNAASTPQAQPASSAPFSGFSLSGVAKDATADKPDTSSNSFGGFQLGGQDKPAADKPSNSFGVFNTPAQPKSTASDQPAPTTSTTPAGLPTFSLKPPTTAVPTTTATASTAATDAPTTSAPSLFGQKATTSTAQPGITITSTDVGGAASGALGASTSGPAPTSQSRLKNRTMDEILTRWASDLTKYQKEFQSQAEKVAEWDQVLVDNMAKITKLYVNAATAEKQTNSVEMQLRAVENQQNELESWLDKYEGEVDDMIAKQNVQQGETLQGPDQERERTYKLAEKLSDRLDEMGNSLTGMIEDINTTSTSLSKTSKSDEPISQIVRILNSHLTQLQAIDQGTIALQAKIATAQKTSQGLGHTLNGSLNGTGAGSGAAEEFYRSYMGRRT